MEAYKKSSLQKYVLILLDLTQNHEKKDRVQFPLSIKQFHSLWMLQQSTYMNCCLMKYTHKYVIYLIITEYL